MRPAALKARRTFVGVIGAWRIRTPVASKIAFAIADPIAAVGGSPEPVRAQFSLNASATTLPVFLLTVTSATIPTWLFAYRPKPKPRPCTTLALDRLDADTLGFQPAAIVAPSITAR